MSCLLAGGSPSPEVGRGGGEGADSLPPISGDWAWPQGLAGVGGGGWDLGLVGGLSQSCLWDPWHALGFNDQRRSWGLSLVMGQNTDIRGPQPESSR